MDNLTHSLVGLAAAKAGLERLSPGATTLCVLATNAPDADVVVGLFSDRWAFRTNPKKNLLLTIGSEIAHHCAIG